MTIEIDRLDHLVLTVKDMEATCRFYTQVLGMKEVRFAHGRVALQFGQQKINLHQSGHEFEPKAARATPGSADLCFIIEEKIETAVAHCHTLDIPILEGPVSRTGATGTLTSIYIRDPDDNLIEIASYQ